MAKEHKRKHNQTNFCGFGNRRSCTIESNDNKSKLDDDTVGIMKHGQSRQLFPLRLWFD